MLSYKTAQQTLETGVQDFIFSQCGTQIYLKFESYNLVKNLVHKGVDFYVQNSLKLTYQHLKFQKNFRWLYLGPWTPIKGEGGEWRSKE